MTRRELLIAGGTAVATGALGEGGAIRRVSAQTSDTPPGGPFTVPPLGYAYDALEPYIDAQTM